MAQVRVTVDGVQYVDEVEPRMLLVYYLRERLGKTGTVVGCDTSNCGACTVHLNGQSVKSCSVLAVQADGGEVTTIEGLARDGQLHPVQKAFNECHALQCGFCTPGMIMQAVDLLGDNPDPDEHEVREGIEGNLCRCTGYQNIVRAVQSAAQAMKPGVPAPAETPAARGRELTMTTTAEPTTTGESASPAPARRTPASSPGAPAGPTTSRCPACCTWPWCARRSRTPGSPASTPTRPAQLPGVIGGLHRRRPRLAEAIACPAPGRSPPTRRRRSAPPLAVDTVHFAGEGVAVVVARDAATARDATELVDVDYDDLPPVLDMEAARRRGRHPRAPRPGHERQRALGVRLRRGRHRRQRDGGDRRGRADPDSIVVRRRFRQQRLIPAFMEPRSVVVDPTGEQLTHVVGHADPAHPPDDGRR